MATAGSTTYVVHDALTALVSTTLVLIGLKLLDLIEWSWWGVFAPVLLPVGLIGLGVIYFTVVIASILIRLSIESVFERLKK